MLRRYRQHDNRRCSYTPGDNVFQVPDPAWLSENIWFLSFLLTTLSFKRGCSFALWHLSLLYDLRCVMVLLGCLLYTFPACLSMCPCVSLSLSLPLSLCLCLSVSLCLPVSVSLWLAVSVSVSVSLCVCVCVFRLFITELYIFNYTLWTSLVACMVS